MYICTTQYGQRIEASVSKISLSKVSLKAPAKVRLLNWEPETEPTSLIES